MLHLKRSTRVAMAFAGVAASSGCGVSDMMEPTDASPATTQLRTSAYTPSASLLRVGIPDGVYTFRIEPGQGQTLVMGASQLQLPAFAACRLGKSGYGADFWSRPCESERKPYTITVVSSGSNTDHPRVDFYPELRFNPAKTVTLSMYDQALTGDDAANWVMYYCGQLYCVNESIKDPSLTSYVDLTTSVIYRRIKHFSGYMVAE